MIQLDDRSLSLARANALANALALARGLASDLDDAELLVGTLASARTNALTRANALASALTDANAFNLGGGLDLDWARALDRDLTLVLTRAFDHARDFDRTLDLDRARGLARALINDLVDLDPTAHWARAVVAGGAWSTPGRVPRGLVGLTVRLLPAPQRPRYRAEFRVELVELPCRKRLGYSVRVLAGAWKLRRALIEAVRTPDGATARRAER